MRCDRRDCNGADNNARLMKRSQRHLAAARKGAVLAAVGTARIIAGGVTTVILLAWDHVSGRMLAIRI